MCPAANTSSPSPSPSSSSSSSSSSSRWCPTPEQLMILEEMYRSGTRTPNASQIQQITAHLSFYGKIEGKNVFYWFQNHKARDRQKLRRKLYKQLQQQQLLFQTHQTHQHMMMINNNNNNNNNHLGPSNHHFLGNSTIIDSPFHFLNPHQQQQLGQVQGTGIVEDHKQYAPRSSHNHNHNHDHHNHNEMMSYTWKMEIPSAGGGDQMRQVDQKGNSMMMMRSTYDRDWMMMLDVGPLPLPSNPNNKPLKTLELFPVTATNLKQDSTTSSKHDHDHDLST